MHKRIRLLTAFLLFSFATATAEQIEIPRVEQMPDLPQPYAMRDWKAVATAYDSLVFDFEREGDYLPLIWWNPNPVNYPNHESFGLETVVGTPRVHAGEAINILPAVIGASLAGIDKSDQNGWNWVLMCEEFFNRREAENVYLNNIIGQSGNDWWYDTMPNIFFYQLYDLYPNTGDFAFQFTSVADRWLQAVEAMGGNTTPWHVPYMNYRAFSLSTMTPNASGVREPEAAGALAWILYNAYSETGEERYRIGAEWAMEFLDGWNSNPAYELQLPYGVLTAARMNAELHTNYDVEQLINWCFEITPLRSWGAILGNWGGYDVHGLIGEVSANDYAFLMNGVGQAGALVPMVRYDDHFSRAVGKWVLNLANATRLFYPNFLPPENQDSEEWAFEYDSASVIGHEALRREINGHSPFATGDAISGGWGYTNLALYGSSHIGILGGIIDTTDVDGILRLDMLKTDYFHQPAYPTYLYYNPHEQEETVSLDVGDQPVDLYDAAANVFMMYNVTGTVEIPLPADAARQLVLAPAAGDIRYELNWMLIDDVVVDFHSDQVVENYPPRIKSMEVAPNPVFAGDTTWVHCTAEDRESDVLSYAWITPDGGQMTDFSPLAWTAEVEGGAYEISCVVTDESGAPDTAYVSVQVIDNHAPVIHEITASETVIEEGGSVTLFCDATDGDQDTLSYRWQAGAGVIEGEGSQVTWQAPPQRGYYTISCTVEDPSGADDTDSVAVSVGSLVLYLPMDGDSDDHSGFGNHANLFGVEETADRDGNAAHAYYFDGNNDVLVIPNSPSLNFTRGITVAFWMNVDVLQEREAFPVSHGSWQNRWKISIIPNHRIRWTVKTDFPQNSGIIDIDSQQPMVADHWYFIVCTFGDGEVSVYRDGAQESSATWGGELLTTDLDLSVGQMLPGNTEYGFSGTLDELQIYNQSLDETDILELYHSYLGLPEEKGNGLPLVSQVFPAYPNPFNSSFAVPVEIAVPGEVRFSLTNILGQVLFQETIRYSAGNHQWSFRAGGATADLSSGLYFLKIELDGNQITQKLLFLK